LKILGIFVWPCGWSKRMGMYPWLDI
jgi:hypothetical protein